MEGRERPARVSGRPRRALGLILLLAALGLALSVQLLIIHLRVDKDPDYPFACRVNKAVDCNAVALSPEAVLLGLPVPAWALAAYGIFIALAASGLAGRRAPWRHGGDYALLLASWSVIYSAYLAYVSLFRIETFCAYCAGLYFVNAGLALASLQAASPLAGWLGRRREDGAWLMLHPPVLLAAGVLAAAAVSGLTFQILRSSDDYVKLAEGGVIDISQDPRIGPEQAPITIIEFSDFECPFCVTMHFRNQELMQKFEGKIRLVQKSYPLDAECNPYVKGSMHPHACAAAFAAECAHRAGKYEAYSERLWMASRDGAILSWPLLTELAKEQGLDPQEFQSCMAGEPVKKAVVEDILAGEKIGIEAIPTFIVNGYKFTGARDLKWSSRLIRKLLAGQKPKPSATLRDQ